METRAQAHVDGGLSGGSRVCRPGSEDPYRRGRMNTIGGQLSKSLYCIIHNSLSGHIIRSHIKRKQSILSNLEHINIEL
jgi:hypothetical protein